MMAKFKSFRAMMGELNQKLTQHKEEIEWYKFKVKQISSRMSKSIL